MTFSDNEFKEAIMEYAARHGYKITKLALDRMDDITMQVRVETKQACQSYAGFKIPGEECEDIQLYPKIS